MKFTVSHQSYNTRISHVQRTNWPIRCIALTHAHAHATKVKENSIDDVSQHKYGYYCETLVPIITNNITNSQWVCVLLGSFFHVTSVFLSLKTCKLRYCQSPLNNQTLRKKNNERSYFFICNQFGLLLDLRSKDSSNTDSLFSFSHILSLFSLFLSICLSYPISEFVPSASGNNEVPYKSFSHYLKFRH